MRRGEQDAALHSSADGRPALMPALLAAPVSHHTLRDTLTTCRIDYLGAGAREGGHGEELLRCPRCKELLPTPKQGRHRCKAASRAASTVAAAVSAAVAAAAEQAAEEEEEGDRKEGRDEQWVPPAAKRRRRIPGRRVRFTLPDSDSEGGSGGSDSEAAADPDGQAAQGLESPQLLPAEALKEHPTPRGAAAAKLLVGMKKGQAPPAVPAAFVPAPARRSAPAPPAAAVAGGEAAGTGIRWWQVAVKPELAAAAASAPAALPPPPPPQVPPPAASPWQQHLLQPPLLMHMQQPPALAATALLGELLHLLKVGGCWGSEGTVVLRAGLCLLTCSECPALRLLGAAPT